MDLFVMMATQQYEVVDVGWSNISVEFFHVMRFAPSARAMTPRECAVSVPCYQCSPLDVGGGSNGSTHPEGLAVFTDDERSDVTVAQQLGHPMLRDDGPVGKPARTTRQQILDRYKQGDVRAAATRHSGALQRSTGHLDQRNGLALRQRQDWFTLYQIGHTGRERRTKGHRVVAAQHAIKFERTI